MIIRKASLNDAEELLKIYAPYVTDTAVSFEYVPPASDEFRSRMEATLLTHPYLVAEEDGEILGYVYASTFHSREAYLHSAETSIYVRSDARGKGIGKALYSALEEALLRQNVYVLYACITVTDRENDAHLTDASVRFHEREGYVLCGKHTDCGWKFGKWYSVIWMEKRLRENPAMPEAFLPFTEL